MDLKTCYERMKQTKLNYFMVNRLHEFSNSDSTINVENRSSTSNEFYQNGDKNCHYVSIFNKTENQLQSTAPTGLRKQDSKHVSAKKNVFLNIPCVRTITNNNSKNVNNKANNICSRSAENVPPKRINAQYVTCPRDMPVTVNYERKVTFGESNNEDSNFGIKHDNTFPTNYIGKNCAEKTTYCRPVLNLYNQEFIYKTMAKNARLQRLVKKLVLVRQRERQNEEWNNYINELKNKHGYYNDDRDQISTHYTQDRFIKSELIDDYYNTRFRCKQSNPCQNLLHDFYGDLCYVQPNACYNPQFNYDCEDRRPRPNYRQHLFENHPFCYPTSSQGRLMMLNREREKNQLPHNWRYRPSNRYFHGNGIVVDKDYSSNYTRVSKSKQSFKSNQYSRYPLFTKKLNENITKSSAMQTDFKIPPLENEEEAKEDTRSISIKDESFKQHYDEVSKNVERLKKKIQKSQNDVKQISLTNIEMKLNELIKTINTFVVEIKTKNNTLRLFKNSKSTSVTCQLPDNVKNNLNMTRSDTYGLIKSKKYICGMVRDIPHNSLAFSDIGTSGVRVHDICHSTARFHKVITEEMYKSNNVKRDIEEIINRQANRPCNVQITFDIPTKERSTEVTDSLSKTRVKINEKKDIVEEIDNSIPGSMDERRMTIAVNTDPLGLLALLRVSTETIKQILSFMPNIDYNSYLSMLQLPYLSHGGVSHYVCNICGAAFGRPSQLSDHIQEHNLGNSRDCCVCRHVMDMQRHRPGLFACRYCGQRFTRAYCRELHQNTCARRLGIRHDVASSLMLLR